MIALRILLFFLIIAAIIVGIFWIMKKIVFHKVRKEKENLDLFELDQKMKVDEYISLKKAKLLMEDNNKKTKKKKKGK